MFFLAVLFEKIICVCSHLVVLDLFDNNYYGFYS